MVQVSELMASSAQSDLPAGTCCLKRLRANRPAVPIW